MDLWVLIVGLVMLAVALPLALLRVFFLYRLITSGQPAPDRVQNVTSKLGLAIKSQVVEVFGQKKLLKWSVPGAAHFFVFWAFLILGTVYLEAFGILFTRNDEWAIPIVGHWDLLGFAQDFIAIMCLVGLATFAMIRLRNNPGRLGRKSRFSGSHLGGAWVILGMIVNVIWTMLLFRGAAATGDEPEEHLPYGGGAFASQAVGKLFGGLTPSGLNVLEGVGLLLHIGVMLAFLIIVLNSKHLHIFVAPLNVLFARKPKALGAVKPLMSEGRPVTLDDIEDMDESATLGIGSIEEFSWKGMLDFATCTECGRCQSQCPAWNTEKPLSPKMLIMNLRDHAFAKAPYILADEGAREGLSDEVKAEAARPLVGETEGYAWEPTGGAVIDTDVLWSCVTCGACVEQCPVDIEHVDHIIDMRRYQVLVEANFPAELNQLFKGMENKGNPWNMSPTARMDWTKGLDFEVKVVGEDIESLDEVDWLFWVGCAGAYEDRAKKTTRAVAELLDMAGVSFGVLGNGETCTGDQARRAGNEFVFQGLAQQNVETFKEFKVKKVVSTCAHCFNTLKNEYKDFGIELEVVHHTQLLNQLVRDGKLTPVADGAGAHKRSITYHDPCYIGRHNGVYTPPRELLQVLPGADFVEMERNSERSFCCGAGGARMWMEENIGERINVNRTNEAVGTGADQIAVGCPFCRVMLSDGLTAAQDTGAARAEVEVLDVAQMLLASVKGEMATRHAPGSHGEAAPAAKAAPAEKSEATKAEPEAGDATQTEDTVTETSEVGPAAKASGGGSSLFDTPDDVDSAADSDASEPETAAEDATPQEEATAAKPASSGGSLFDLGDDGSEEESADKSEDKAEDKAEGKAEGKAEPEKPAAEPTAKKSSSDLGSGGSLFDLGGDEEPEAEAKPAAEPEPEAKDEPEPEPQEKAPEPAADLGSGGSLFDIEAEEAPAPAAEKPEKEPEAETEPEPEPEPAPQAEPKVEPTPEKPAVDLSSGGSLFDIEPEEEPAPAATKPEKEPETETRAEPEPEPKNEPEQPGVDLGSGGSLFDIAAPESAPAATSQPDPQPDPEPEPEPEPDSDSAPAAEPESDSEPDSEPESEPDPEPELTGGAAVSQAATSAASNDDTSVDKVEPEPEAGDDLDEPEAKAEPAPEPEADAEADAQAEAETDEESEEQADEKPKPASSGEAHQPKTDVDIPESGSLFDL